MRRFVLLLCALLLTIITVGCGGNYDISPGSEVDVTGEISGANVKNLDDVVLYFQATGGKAKPANFKLVGGKFSGKLVQGKYTYYLDVPQSGNTKKAEASLKNIPDDWKRAKMEREIDIKGGEVILKFN